MRRRQFAFGRLRGVYALGALFAVACESPTLPLPPPEIPNQSEGPDAQHITLTAECGAAQASAIVIILNQNPTLRLDQQVSGTVASACGSWDAIVLAHTGDTLLITQMAGDLTSPATLYNVR